MFNTLNEKFEKIVSSLRGKAIISEDDLDLTLREIRIALLEADVALLVVKDFINNVKSNVLGKKILKNINPDQMIIKLVYDELVTILGSDNEKLNINNEELKNNNNKLKNNNNKLKNEIQVLNNNKIFFIIFIISLLFIKIKYFL